MKAAFVMAHERDAARDWLATEKKTGEGACEAIRRMGYSHTRSAAWADIARADFLATEIAEACGVCGASRTTEGR